MVVKISNNIGGVGFRCRPHSFLEQTFELIHRHSTSHFDTVRQEPLIQLVRQCSIRFANNNQSQLSETYWGHGLSLSRHTHFTTSHATHVSTVQNRFKSMREPF